MADVETRYRVKMLNDGISFTSMLTRPKLIMAGSCVVTSAADVTITHNAGEIPIVKVWQEQLSGEITEPVLVSIFTPAYHSRYFSTYTVQYHITTTTLVFEALALGGPYTTYYRIYVA